MSFSHRLGSSKSNSNFSNIRNNLDESNPTFQRKGSSKLINDKKNPDDTLSIEKKVSGAARSHSLGSIPEENKSNQMKPNAIERFKNRMLHTPMYLDVTAYIKNLLLNLDNKSSFDHIFSKDSNGKKFIDLIDLDPTLLVPPERLYRDALGDLIKLVKFAPEKLVELKTTDKSNCIKEIAIYMGIPEKKCEIFFNIYTGLTNDPKKHLTGSDLKKVLELLETHKKHLENLHFALLSKDPKCQSYIEFIEKQNRKVDYENLIIIQCALETLCKNGKIGSVGMRIPMMKAAGKSTEWNYIYLNRAFTISSINQGKKAEIFYQKSVKTDVNEIKHHFCEVVDVLSSCLKLKEVEAINTLKKYFINANGIDNDFDFDLISFSNVLGFTHHFGISEQQLKDLQNEMMTDQYDWEKVKLRIHDNPPLLNFLEIICHAVTLKYNSVNDHLMSVCNQFEKMCKMLYLIESDKENTKRWDLMKLLAAIKFIHQDFAITYLSLTFKPLHNEMTLKEDMFKSLKDPSTPSKQYEFCFKEDSLIYKGKSYYDFDTSEKDCYILKETVIVETKLEDILNNEKWKESFKVKIILKQPASDKAKQHLDIFINNLKLNEIPYKIKNQFPSSKS